MQLRVARLCLDCEELHNDTRCPRCASESFAFLTNWLPSEERRRWRRSAPPALRERSFLDGGLLKAVGRWLSGDTLEPQFDGPATRAADRAALLSFTSEDNGDVLGELDVHLPKHDIGKA